MFGIFASALFPNRCLSCGSLFYCPCGAPADRLPQGQAAAPASCSTKRIFKALMSPFLCPGCMEDFSPVTSPVCPQCGHMFQSREGNDHLCGNCLEKHRFFTSARAGGIYESTLRQAIHHFKYKGKTGLAKPLGRFLFNRFKGAYPDNPVDLVMPVPLHVKKLKQRGFNQAFLLVREWEALFTAVCRGPAPFTIDSRSLTRCRHTASQTRLNKRQRRANIKRAFSLKNPSAVRNKSVLLVDDVYTTGATVDECAKVLLDGGAARVHVLTLARGW